MSTFIGSCDDTELDPGTKLPFLIFQGVESWLYCPPKEHPWLIPGLLPESVPTVLASRGGVGKSWIALQGCFSLATGKPFLGIPVGPPRGAVFLSLEDSEHEVHRRVYRLAQLYREAGDLTREDEANLEKHLLIASVDWQHEDATTYLPRLVPHLEAFYGYMAQNGIQPGLLVVDTLTRVSDGDENSVQAVRPVMTAALRLASTTGVTPLILHHVGKGQDGIRGARKDKPTIVDRLALDWVRGAGAIVDNSRCVLQIAVIREDEAEPLGLDVDHARAGGYAVLAMTKINGGRLGPWTAIQQTDCGAWVPMPDGVELVARMRGRKAVDSLNQQGALVLELFKAWKRGVRADRSALALALCGGTKHPETSFRSLLRKARNSGFVNKTTLDLTVQGIQFAQTHKMDTPGDQEDTPDE